MGIVFGIWNSLLGFWINIGLRLFPPVIHPMLVHFPIVLLWGSLLLSLLSLVWRTPDRFLDRSSFWLLVLGLVAGIVAAATGVLSEQYVKWTPATSALLGTHQAYAVLTGVFTILAIISRLIARYSRNSPTDRPWSLNRSGRGRTTGLSLIFLAVAVVMVTMTASIGGTMVYQYGVGIHGVSYRTPPQLASSPHSHG